MGWWHGGSASLSHHRDKGPGSDQCRLLIKVTLVTCEWSVIQFDSTKHSGHFGFPLSLHWTHKVKPHLTLMENIQKLTLWSFSLRFPFLFFAFVFLSLHFLSFPSFLSLPFLPFPFFYSFPSFYSFLSLPIFFLSFFSLPFFFLLFPFLSLPFLSFPSFIFPFLFFSFFSFPFALLYFILLCTLF